MTRGVGGSTAEAELARIAPRRDEVAPIDAAERWRRIERAQERMRETGVSALWLDASTSLEYFTGVRHRQTERLIGALVPASGEPIYLAPAFEAEKLSTMLTVGSEIRGWEEDESPFALLIQTLRDRQIARGTVAIDEHTRFFVADGIREAADGDFGLVPSAGVAGWLRARKVPAEIALIGHAMRTTVEIQAAAARILREGITTTEVQTFLSAAHRAAGFDDDAFAIALFGEATAYPHGVPHPQTLREGDMVLIDCGAPMHGYVSDIHALLRLRRAHHAPARDLGSGTRCSGRCLRGGPPGRAVPGGRRRGARRDPGGGARTRIRRPGPASSDGPRRRHGRP